MDFTAINKDLRLRMGTYRIVRPGITIRLSYSDPIQSIGAQVAESISAFLRFVKPENLVTYLSSSGWKKIRSNIISRDLKELRSIPSSSEAVEYHYSQGEPGNVGTYGISFVGSALPKTTFPLEENLLLLQLPHDFCETRCEELVLFVNELCKLGPFSTGCVGFAFHHLPLTNLEPAESEIEALAPRYIGFDIDSAIARYNSRAHIYNISWLTMLGNESIDLLGGRDALFRKVSSSLQLSVHDTGAIIRAAQAPIAGDVNAGAPDADPLRQLAPMLSPLRERPPRIGFGPGDAEFANRWLSRFDN